MASQRRDYSCVYLPRQEHTMLEKRTLNCDRPLPHLQLACCLSYCGVPVSGNNVLIYSNEDKQRKPLLLTGHHHEICAMTFGKQSRPLLLCSASADYVIVWDIERCQGRTQEGKIAFGTVIGSLLGEVVHLSYCFSDERVAACSGVTVYILSSKKNEVICSLKRHHAAVTSAEFCPWNEDILVTTSEDRTFKVWDLKAEAVCYESAVLSASPLISLLFLEENNQFITGSSDGQLWCFSLPDGHTCRLVTKMDLQKMEKRYQIHQGNVSKDREVTEQSSPDDVETSKPVLKMISYRALPDFNDDHAKYNSLLCIGSTDGLYVVDLASSELQSVMYFKDYNDLSITTAGSWIISQRLDNSMFLFVSSLFTPHVVLLELSLSDHQRISPRLEGLSLFPSSPPLPESPLNAELKKREVNYPKRKGGIKEQPLVFHSKVRSSGYTSTPRRTMFSPKTNVQKSVPLKKAQKKTFLLKDYPADSAAPSVPHIHQNTGSKPVHCLQYSGDGKQILCGLGDSSVLLYKSSLTGNPTVHTGHDKPVSSVSWSLNRQWWLSASKDHSIRIWTQGSPEPAIIMANGVFSKPIRGAQFYYLDKFILVASGPSLHLYLYNVDITRDDIKRYNQRSVVQLAGSFTTTSATDITAMSAINDFYSYIVLVCGSDRSIQVFDLNKGVVVSELPDAHSRAVHCITQNKGSMFSTQAPESHNLFLTNAVTDGMKIWDLRTLRCERRYENHLNRCHPCSSAISPCGRFIATGSEDNSAYVYDVRSSSFLHKLQRHSDTVLSVTFNPATPEVLKDRLPSHPNKESTQEMCTFSKSPNGPLLYLKHLRQSPVIQLQDELYGWTENVNPPYATQELLTGTLDGNLRLFQPSSGSSNPHGTSAAV